MNSNELRDLVEVAVKIQLGGISSEEANRALMAWDHSDGMAADMVHFLYHFIADADLRERDASYKRHQVAHLEALLKALRKLEDTARGGP